MLLTKRYAVVASDRNKWYGPRVVKYTITRRGAERERRYFARLAFLVGNHRDAWTVERV